MKHLIARLRHSTKEFRLRSAHMIFALLLAGAAQAQIAAPRSLASLLADMSQVVHGSDHSLSGPLCDAIDEVIDRSPETMKDAVPVIIKDLNDSDPEVRRMTLIALVSMARKPEGKEIAVSLSSQIARSISDNDEYVRRAALLVIETMYPDAPDRIAESLEKALTDDKNSDELRAYAAETLLMVHPNATGPQMALICFIDNAQIAKSLRITVLETLSREQNLKETNPMLFQHIQDLATHADDKDIRDAAADSVMKKTHTREEVFDPYSRRV